MLWVVYDCIILTINNPPTMASSTNSPTTTKSSTTLSPSLEKKKNMDTTSLRCELKIMRAKNIEFSKLSDQRHMFVRCYLPTGNHNRNVQVNSKEIISTNNSDLFWDDSFSLECSGAQEAMESLKKGNVVFELRCRKKSVLGNSSSKLLGRAEIPWKTVFESPNMENETWVPMISTEKKKKNCLRRRRSVIIDDGDLIYKPPSIQVSMKIIRVLDDEEEKRSINKRAKNIVKEECCCKDCNNIHGCHSFADFDVFAIGFALDAF